MDVSVVKVIVLFTLFLMTFLLGILPFLLRNIFQKHADTESHKSRYKSILSFLSCYAAGVFVATGVLDLLPDVRVDIGQTLNQLNIFTSFPVAEFIMMFGLFLMLMMEQIVLQVKEKREQNEDIGKVLHPDERTTLLSRQGSTTDHVSRPHGHAITSQYAISGINDESLNQSYPGMCTDHQHIDSQDHISFAHDFSDKKTANDCSRDILPEHEHSSLRAVMLVLALSLHSIFEGLAVGLQKKTDDVLGIFGALVIHKSVVSFCLGMNLISSGLSNSVRIRSVLFFALTTPVGVGIGIGILDVWNINSSLLVQGILTGIACGTFLYVTFFEVLPSEFNSPDHRLLKVLFVILGFSTITGVLFLSSNNDPTCFIKPT